MKKLLILLIAAGLVFTACQKEQEEAAEVLTDDTQTEETVDMDDEGLESIAAIAVANGSFTTLVAALSAADLVDTLSGEGTFTVFAPTDDAFAALPEGTVETLLEDPSGALTQILLYHVVGSVAMAEDVVGLSSVTTLQGEEVTIEVVDGGVVLNGNVNVTTTDIKASNGVIHVIDAVLMPENTESQEVDASTSASTGVGSFVPYTENAIANANDKIVLAFFAEWCPACNAAEKDLNANGDQIPGDVTIIEVNYDDATALKEKYNVTGQHTFVQIDSAGELLKKWRGGERVTEIVAQIQ